MGRRFSLSSFMAFAGAALLLTEATENETAKVEFQSYRISLDIFTFYDNLHGEGGLG